MNQYYINIVEQWKYVPGSIKYQVSNQGNFRRKLKNGKYKLLTPYFRKNSWMGIKVDFNGIYKEYKVHTIVAAVFLKKPIGEDIMLYHKNGVKKDNYATNLEWISRIKLGHITGGATNKCIPVVKYDKDTGEMLDFYKSISEAARYNYIHRETIRGALRGKQKTAAGFVWKKEEYYFLSEEKDE